MDTKQCSKCKQDLPVSEFWKDKHKADGLRSACRACNKNNPEYMRKYYRKNKDGSIREWRDANKEVLSERAREWQRANPERYKELQRRSHLKKYGLTPESYDAMLEAQDGGCRVCGAPSNLQIDHDHGCCPGKESCGKCVRGILCGPCNTVLGMVNDNPARLSSLIKYLGG